MKNSYPSVVQSKEKKSAQSAKSADNIFFNFARYHL